MGTYWPAAAQDKLHVQVPCLRTLPPTNLGQPASLSRLCLPSAYWGPLPDHIWDTNKDLADREQILYIYNDKMKHCWDLVKTNKRQVFCRQENILF